MAVELQNEDNQILSINEDEIIHWVTYTLNQLQTDGDICLIIADENLMKELNCQYRNQNKSTNVLSFPSELPDDIQQELRILGDIFVCPAVLASEAEQLNKPLRDHWAHICVHGVLHLLGYDHMEENETKIMQAEEINILAQLDIPNPYCEIEGANIER